MEKSDTLKIGIMLTYTGKEASEIYEMLPWTEPDDKMKFDKVVLVRTYFMNSVNSGVLNKGERCL